MSEATVHFDFRGLWREAVARIRKCESEEEGMKIVNETLVEIESMTNPHNVKGLLEGFSEGIKR